MPVIVRVVLDAHVRADGADAGAVNAAEADLEAADAEEGELLREGALICPGADERAERHVAAHPREAIEKSSHQSR